MVKIASLSLDGDVLSLPVAPMNACSRSRRVAKPTKRVFDDFGALPLIASPLRVKHGTHYFVRQLHYAAGEVRNYTRYSPLHRTGDRGGPGGRRFD